MNKRNAHYVMRYNERKYYPLVDDKARSKQLAIEAGIAVPELYGIIEIEHQIRDLPEIIGEHKDFVIKPAHGAGGGGILVIAGRRRGGYIKSSGVIIKEEEVAHHISNILSGMYSLGGTPDQALIEYRVRSDPVFDPVSYQGVPDVRTVVFRGVPVAAMIRLPTRQSDGKANLHQGAIGVGIDIGTGRALAGVHENVLIGHHPDTGAPIGKLTIPHWDTVLELAARSYELVKLGYLGVDIVLDRDKGPLVLEYNARPGLNIQLANHEGLMKRLAEIERRPELPASASARVALAKELFSRLPKGGSAKHG